MTELSQIALGNFSIGDAANTALVSQIAANGGSRVDNQELINYLSFHNRTRMNNSQVDHCQSTGVIPNPKQSSFAERNHGTKKTSSICSKKTSSRGSLKKKKAKTTKVAPKETVERADSNRAQKNESQM